MNSKMTRWIRFVIARYAIARTGFWFVDVPRTGSSSIRAELGREYGAIHGKSNLEGFAVPARQVLPDHLPAAQVREIVGGEVWQSLYSFSVVRDPWSRTRSMWSWRKHEGSLGADLSFGEYVERLTANEDPSSYRPHTASCSWFLTAASGELLIDDVVRFDERKTGLAAVSRRLPGHPQLGEVHILRSDGTQQAWDASLVRALQDFYAEDVERFKFIPPEL